MQITINNYEEYSLNEINVISNQKLQKEILNQIQENYLSPDIPIKDIYKKVEVYYQENTSNYFSTGDLVFFYPFFKEKRASKQLTSDLTGNYIYPKSSYYEYYFLIWNKSLNQTFISQKKYKICLDELDYVPQNLADFEDFEINLVSAYTNGNEQYYNYSVQLGFESFPVKRLNKSK